jgi:hypothetical protein
MESLWNSIEGWQSIDGNVYAVYLVEQVWTGVKSTITEENVCIR